MEVLVCSAGVSRVVRGCSRLGAMLRGGAPGRLIRPHRGRCVGNGPGFLTRLLPWSHVIVTR